ncbi:hypothetical protein NY2A_b478L [Paramecium bursaria Chlorella virus NY2A]|uniref:Uncharacterized protein b478L n=1 Tax=Paramecium bursaria Chlorella virus NY2A TaxID=46021 RepID=A7IX03_PBCVN|nr:hypothetical protein NY2A_b478L [Paramecium bursaria Chlorella virus NY2A]ABT14877.1 hypothetical protein NY2A_b478L [Paramecium bursaria Chlorella virus NY2A]
MLYSLHSNAIRNGVRPLQSFMLMSALREIRSSTNSSRPRSTAKCKGVYEVIWLITLISAPSSNIVFIIFTFPIEVIT